MALFKSLERLPQKEAPTVPKFTNIDLSIKELDNNLKSVENIHEDDIVSMIKNSYKIILDDIFLRDEKNRDYIIEVFNNKKFIQSFISVMQTIELNYSQKVCCNKITWDYLSSCEKEDEEIKNLLLKLSSVVNKDIIPMLSTIVPLKIAKMMALCRYSSFKEKKNIERVNYIIIKTAGITEQNIIDIYALFFKTEVSKLFETIMLDVWTNFNNEDEVENYGLISLSIMDILESMPSQNIQYVLTSYSGTLTLQRIKSVRFSMYSNSKSDYPRVYSVIEELEKDPDIKIY